MNFSIVICCYNGAPRIEAVLSHIRRLNSSGLSYEVILVNNACSDLTVPIAVDFARINGLALRVVDEMRLGLSNAREAGWRAAVGEFVLFCDDDNFLDENYLIEASILMRDQELGAVGGLGIAMADCDLPDWFIRYQTSYACGFFYPDKWYVDQLTGAGLVIRRLALIELFEAGFSSQLSDRKGSSLSSGGDGELTLALSIRGWRLLWDPVLKFGHYMPAGRLSLDYIERLYYSFGHADPIMFEYRRSLRLKRGIPLRLADRVPLWGRALSFNLKNCLNKLSRNKSVDAVLKKAALSGAVSFFKEARREGYLFSLRNNLNDSINGWSSNQ